jgi:catechol 2,3-dioxygenase-like lactoylglutathione lyase family enzyme
MEVAFNPLIPEFCVTDLAASLPFYKALGFMVLYARPENGFAFLEREGAQLMLEEKDADTWMTGAFEYPLGRGAHVQIRASDINALYATAQKAKLEFYKPIYEKWYRVGDTERGNRQFLVQDPDGYLLRFYENLGVR